MSSESPEYYFKTVSNARHTHLIVTGPSPRSLSEALPNRHSSIRGTGITFQFSELVVAGDVIEVREGPAFAHGRDDTIYPVAFDDPTAVEHAFDVVVRVAEEFGARTGQLGLRDRTRVGPFLP